VTRIDAGDPLVLLAGIHVGCFELFGTARVRSVRDLKGKTVAVPALGSSHHIFVASMAAYVGLNPQTDIHWAIHRGPDAMQRLAEGTIDGLIGFPPSPRSYGRSRSDMWWSTRGRTAPGRSISAA
jgi:NitT/TauT family transport system substrate-binding protein